MHLVVITAVHFLKIIYYLLKCVLHFIEAKYDKPNNEVTYSNMNYAQCRF